MIPIITLHFNSLKPVSININAIAFITGWELDNAVVRLVDGTDYYVIETHDEILELIRGIMDAR